MKRFKLILSALFGFAACFASDFDMNFEASVQANGGSGDFAPYYISSLRHGYLTSSAGGYLGLKADKPIDISKRFSYSFGAQGWIAPQSKVDYQRFNSHTQQWDTRSLRPSPAILQQLYGQVKFRGVYLLAGLHDFSSALLNERLSSGDLIESGNSRNIPQVRMGFIDFQNIPFTNGWVQIQGELAYGKETDNGWLKDHYNYYGSHLTLGGWYHYKRCYFRTKPSQPFSVTVGLQSACQFSGQVEWFNRNGQLHQSRGNKFAVRSLLDVLLTRFDETYYQGNHLGAWDFQARYRLRNGSEIKAYFSWLWEDGSGIGKLNGMDGLWGLEYSSSRKDAAVSGAVLEFMTYMNQGGPIHYSPSDYKEPTLQGQKAEGADNYYNNHETNGYALWGMAIGSPMFISPVYNTNGAVTQYLNNRFWGIHGAVEGQLYKDVRYRAMASYRRFFGTPFIPAITPTYDVSVSVEAQWQLRRVPGLELSAQLASDAGTSAYGHNFGALLSARYSFSLRDVTKKK